MITLLAITIAAFDPGVRVVADTPVAAVQKLAQLEGGKDRTPVIPPRAFAGMPRPGDGIDFAASIIPRSGVPDRLIVRVTAMRNSRVITRRVYAFTWRTKLAVVVPKKSIERGEVVRESDLTFTEMEAAADGQGLVLAPGQLIGRVAKIRLAKDQPVRLTDVVLPRVIERGQEISVEASFGRMVVRMKGIALSAGAVGDTIRIRNAHTKKLVEATVTTFGVAEVKR